MQINEELVGALLFEEEGTELDFKSNQYRFVKASDKEKGELLKDLLAFVNAFRRADAFILIGIKEVKGGKSQVLGFKGDSLDDAALQQFVNNKTQRPIQFSYKNLTLEGKKIAIIHIPIQPRPIYLKKDYGNLKKETVYIRRGSSTGIATLEEISHMGSQQPFLIGLPELKLSFADPHSRIILPDRIELESLNLITPNQKSIPDYKTQDNSSSFLYMPSLYNENRSYYRELTIFTKISKLTSPVYLAISNHGRSIANDVRIEIKIPDEEENIVIINEKNYPEIPSTQNDYLIRNSLMDQLRNTPQYDVEAQKVSNYWLIEAGTEKVQAKNTVWLEKPFYIGAKKNTEVECEINIFCDDLPEPVFQTLAINIKSETHDIDLQGIRDLEYERMRNSPKYKKLLKNNDS